MCERILKVIGYLGIVVCIQYKKTHSQTAWGMHPSHTAGHVRKGSSDAHTEWGEELYNVAKGMQHDECEAST